MKLSKNQEEMCDQNKWDFSDLKTLFINCTLKKSGRLSHTNGLIEISKAIMEKNHVQVEVIRAVDYNIAYGVYPDMTEHGWDKDDFNTGNAHMAWRKIVRMHKNH